MKPLVTEKRINTETNFFICCYKISSYLKYYKYFFFFTLTLSLFDLTTALLWVIIGNYPSSFVFGIIMFILSISGIVLILTTGEDEMLQNPTKQKLLKILTYLMAALLFLAFVFYAIMVIIYLFGKSVIIDLLIKEGGNSRSKARSIWAWSFFSHILSLIYAVANVLPIPGVCKINSQI